MSISFITGPLKNRGLLLILGLLLCPPPSFGAVTYFYSNGGIFNRTDTITLTQSGPVYVQTGGDVTSNDQSGDNRAYIYIDGTLVDLSFHSVRDGSTTYVEAVWQVTLPAGAHQIRTQVNAEAYAAGTYTYIRLENESGPLDNSTVAQINALIQTATGPLEDSLTTIVQSTEADLQNQINTNAASIAQLQQELADLQNGQSTNVGAIASDESALAILQAQNLAQESQLQTLMAAEALHNAKTQSDIDALSGRITVLNNTAARKSPINTGLLYGAAAAGSIGLGLGAYGAFSGSVPSGTSLLDATSVSDVAESPGDERNISRADESFAEPSAHAP